jgi:hypothetical protein
MIIKIFKGTSEILHLETSNINHLPKWFKFFRRDEKTRYFFSNVPY